MLSILCAVQELVLNVGDGPCLPTCWYSPTPYQPCRTASRVSSRHGHIEKASSWMPSQPSTENSRQACADELEFKPLYGDLDTDDSG